MVYSISTRIILSVAALNESVLCSRTGGHVNYATRSTIVPSLPFTSTTSFVFCGFLFVCCGIKSIYLFLEHTCVVNISSTLSWLKPVQTHSTGLIARTGSFTFSHRSPMYYVCNSCGSFPTASTGLDIFQVMGKMTYCM
jgi:hypothetical protein